MTLSGFLETVPTQPGPAALRGAVAFVALDRHKRAHLPATIVKAQEAAEVTRADALLGRLGELSGRAETMFVEAERILRGALRKRDHHTALEAIRTACHAVREGRGVLGLALQVAIAGVEAEANRRAEEAYAQTLRRLGVALSNEAYTIALDVLSVEHFPDDDGPD